MPWAKLLLITLLILLRPPGTNPKSADDDSQEKSATEQSEEPQPAATTNIVGELGDKVLELVEQLDADSRLDRNDAEEALIAMGPEILDLLDSDATRSAAGEAAMRISRIRNTLQLQAINESTLSTKVTIEGEMTIAQAFAKIQQQTGNEIRGVEDREEVIGVSLEEAPFWIAMDKVLDSCGLTIDDYGGNGEALVLIPRGLSPDRTDQAVYEGIFRISNSRLSLTRNLENPQLDLFRVTIKVAWEPRLQPISIGIPMSELSIQDDVGDPIPVMYQGASVSSQTHGQPTLELTLPIGLPSRAAEFVEIEGTIEAVVPGRMETFEFTNLKAKEKQEVRHGQATVTLDGVGKNRDLFETQIRVRFEEAGDSLESHRGWVQGNQAVLIKKDGTEIETISEQMYYQAENEVGYKYRFDIQEIPDDLKLVYKSPAAVVTLPVKFHLKRIELP